MPEKKLMKGVAGKQRLLIFAFIYCAVLHLREILFRPRVSQQHSFVAARARHLLPLFQRFTRLGGQAATSGTN
ncbi:MAG: hypothetical protein ACU0AZ_05400 [Paracoccaceae bacterium]|jgi:hypothetical protein